MNQSNRSFLISAGLLTFTGIFLVGYAVFSYLNTSVVITWQTATEFDTAGYTLYRSESPEGPYERITAELILASPDPLTGGDYSFTDTDVQPGKTYFYQLEEVEFSGTASREGPIEVQAAFPGIAESALGAILLFFAWYTFRLAQKQREALSE